MAEGYEELFKSLIEKEMTAPDESVQDTKRNAIASLIPMAAGVLTGQVSQGAQLGMSTYKTLEDQRSKSRGKLLDYLAKMNAKKASHDWQMKDTESGVVMFDKNSGQFKETGLQPFQKDYANNWKQVGGADTVTFFRENPESGQPEIYDTKRKIPPRPVSPFLGLAEEEQRRKKEEAKEKKIQAYSEDTEPLRKLEAPLAEIENFINKYNPKDIPGVGAIDIQLAKFGLKGDVKNPKLTPEEASFANAVQTLVSTKSFAEGGKALSAIENQLIRSGIGLLEKGGEENFRQGIKQIREGLNSAYANMKAKYPEEVSSEYRSRGGSETTQTNRFQTKKTRSINEIRSEKAKIEEELKKLKGNK